MDVKNLSPDIKRLGGHLDNLEETLQPLIDNLPEMSSELPLLEKAKLMTLTAYSIESLLFSALRMQGVEASQHEVMSELKRVKQYFAKIQQAEEGPGQRSATLNQEAAARVLKADLADNSEIKKKLEAKIAEERAKALLKSVQNKPMAEDSSDNSASKKRKGGKGAKASDLTSRPKQKKRKG